MFVVDCVVLQLHIRGARDVQSAEIVFMVPPWSMKIMSNVADMTQYGAKAVSSNFQYASTANLSASDGTSNGWSTYTC